MPDDIYVNSLFRSLGFYENEIRAYLGLAEIGKSTAHLLSKKLGIPRSTAYAALESLVKKGLVSIAQKGATTFFSVFKQQEIVNVVAVV